MGRIECGDGEDGEPVGAHRAGPNGRRRAGMLACAWMINWGGREARRGLPFSLLRRPDAAATAVAYSPRRHRHVAVIGC